MALTIYITIQNTDINPSSCSENILWTNKQILKEKILKITKLNFPFFLGIHFGCQHFTFYPNLKIASIFEFTNFKIKTIFAWNFAISYLNCKEKLRNAKWIPNDFDSLLFRNIYPLIDTYLAKPDWSNAIHILQYITNNLIWPIAPEVLNFAFNI